MLEIKWFFIAFNEHDVLLKETVSGAAAEHAYEHFKNYLGIVEPSELESSIVPYVML